MAPKNQFKIPMFDRDHYEEWVLRMKLYLESVNPEYLEVLDKGKFVPMVVVPEHTEGDVIIPQRSEPKKVADFSDADKEQMALDTCVRQTLMESLDHEMFNVVKGLNTAKKIWDKIEVVMEGTSEVRSNKTLILKMEYDTFRIRKGESITDVYLRFSQLVLDLNLRGVTLPMVEVNTRYLRNQPKSIEHRVYAVRETRDMHTTSLEQYYGILKTYELETLQDQAWDNDSKGKETTSGLVADEEESGKAMVATKPKSSPASHQVDNDDECTSNSDDDYFTQEELDNMDDSVVAYMARKFSNIRFRKSNRPQRKSSSSYRVTKGGSSSSGYKGKGKSTSYKSPLDFKMKFKCYNCGEAGHFASDCKKPKQTYPKETYENLKSKYEALVKERHGKKALVVTEGRAWDDSDEEEVTYAANFALMADTSDEPEVPVLTLREEMSIDEYKVQNGALSEEIYMLCKSLNTSQKEQKTLIAKCRMLEAKVEELEAACTIDTSLRDSVKTLENKLKLKDELEACLRNKLAELETKCEAYKLAASKVNVDSETFKKITGINVGLDYSNLSKKDGKRPVDISSSETSTLTPIILRSAVKPIFKQFVPHEEGETDLLVRHEIEMEDRKTEQLVTPIKSVKIKSPREESRTGLGVKAVKQQIKREKGIKEVKAENVKKACYHCKSTEHLSYACKSNMNVPVAHAMPAPQTMNNMHHSHVQCGQPNCMPCTFNVMQTFVNLMNATSQTCVNSNASVKVKKKFDRARTVSPPKVRSDKSSPKSNKSVKTEKGKDKVESSSNVKKVASSVVKSADYRSYRKAGPNQSWVPKNV